MFRRWAIGLCLLLAAGVATATRAAVGDLRAAQPTTASRTSLGDPLPEAPHVPDLDPSRCAACRLAAVTTGRVAPAAVETRTLVLRNGISLRFQSRDPEVVDLLWKASAARDELLAALRSGHSLELCTRCSARRDLWFDLQIATSRLSDGILLEYTATRPDIVRDLHRIAADPSLTAQF